jgi:cytoskeletal protein RodZ
MNDQSNVYAKDSIGDFLRTEREKQGLDLNDIFQITKIRPNILEFIETDQFDRASTSDIFLISFLKSYAQALKLDPEPVIKKYRTGVAQKNLPPAKGNFVKRGISPQLLAVGVFIILTICLLLMIVPSAKKNFAPDKEDNNSQTDVLFGELDNNVDFSYHNKPVTFTEYHPVTKTVQTITDSSESDSESDTQEESAQQTQENKRIAEKYSLRLKAIEKTWLKITVDDQPPNEFMLKPGDVLSKEADNEFQLLLGNATGLEIYLNDELIKVSGRPGQVKTLKLP